MALNRYASSTYTSAQSGVTLVAAPPDGRGRIHVISIVFAADADNTVSPAMKVRSGSNQLFEHPGVPAGGGMVVSGIDAPCDSGAALLFDCDAPTGGSCSVAVIYYIQ